MGNDSDKPESGAGEPEPPKIKAEDNPWYLLATLYGVPERRDQELKDKNRVAWNRYFAANLDEETRAKLIEEKRHPAEELTPFSAEELQKVASAFAERCKASAKKLALPDSSSSIDFSYVEFEQNSFFEGYSFIWWTDFQDATFSGLISFAGATFSDWAIFGGAAFSGLAIFRGATFSGNADFAGAAFSGLISFGGAAFSGSANFHGATFSEVASFDGAAFSGVAIFEGATFGKESSFVNAEMKGETSFKGVIFKEEPPKFFGAKLHQGTIWRGITWPPVPKNKDEAGTFLDAYACLKLEMDRLKKHEDELDFFALEMQSRRVLLGPWRGLPFAIYGALSGYGRSYLRPLVALVVVAAAGAGAFWYFDARTYGEALGLSAANTLNVFGFRRDLGLAIDTPLAWLKAFSALQTILGTILLFIFGLGIRNKFRVK
jgi:uncharacterized protein YjbI with pentapeptide repeats